MRLVAALFVFASAATPVVAHGDDQRGRHAQGIPPGHLPPPGKCRVWYDNRPPGHQPPPTSCGEAERIAARDRNARVIHGSERATSDERSHRHDESPGRERAVPRRDSRLPPPDRSRNGDRDRSHSGDQHGKRAVPFDNGYKDGYDKGREDGGDNDRYDPIRHSRYRSADRGYTQGYGSRDTYKDIYREGFRAGYEAGYRETHAAASDDRPRTRSRLPRRF